jgi:hypothetical protein
VRSLGTPAPPEAGGDPLRRRAAPATHLEDLHWI